MVCSSSAPGRSSPVAEVGLLRCVAAWEGRSRSWTYLAEAVKLRGAEWQIVELRGCQGGVVRFQLVVVEQCQTEEACWRSATSLVSLHETGQAAEVGDIRSMR